MATMSFEELMIENKRLREQVSDLEYRLSFLEGHRTLAEGMRGEKLIAGLVAGEITCHTASYDVELPSGIKIEVKSSRLNLAIRKGTTQRWAWGKIFGDNGKKDFDFLLLVGERDNRFRDLYKDITNPYVFFLIPRSDVAPLTMKNGKVFGIQLTTNPAKAQSRAAVLFSRYQVTSGEIKMQFGL